MILDAAHQESAPHNRYYPNTCRRRLLRGSSIWGGEVRLDWFGCDGYSQLPFGSTGAQVVVAEPCDCDHVLGGVAVV